MEQIFMIEIFVKKIVLKIIPPEKDEFELAEEAERLRLEAEQLAALEAAKKGKKGKPPKPKKPKKGKQPLGPSEEELKYMQTCTMQMNCKNLFDLYIGHDNFVAPPPPPPPPKKGKGKAAKPKKGKAKVVPFKIQLPSEPLPQPPYFGVGNSIIFISRPSDLADVLKKNPIYITVWNKDENMNCIGVSVIHWHDSYFECLKKAEEANPIDWEKGEYRDTKKPEMMTTTVEFIRQLECEEDLVPSGEVEVYVRLSCLGKTIISDVVSFPDMERIPARKYIIDENKIKDLEVVRHWEGTTTDTLPAVAYFFGAPDISKEPIKEVQEIKVFDGYEAPFTTSELQILAMGFPKGPCGGVNCPKRMEFRGSETEFIPGEMVNKKYVTGQFVNKRDVHGPCGKLDCPLARKVRSYLCNEGAYKQCQKPCCKSYY